MTKVTDADAQRFIGLVDQLEQDVNKSTIAFNGGETDTYTSNNGVEVPSYRKWLKDKEGDIANAEADKIAAQQAALEAQQQAGLAAQSASDAESTLSSAYKDAGEYAAGIEITERNQVVVDGDDRWVISAATPLPYTTTGAGMPEGGAFVSVGDAALRQELAAPGGAGLVGNGGILFNSIADMQAATWLKVGQKVRTLGYYNPGDGGGNDYEIVANDTGTDDGGSFIDLFGSWLQARGLFSDVINVKTFGAKGDGTSDDTAPIQSAMTFSLSSRSDGLYFSTYIPSGDYLVYKQLTLEEGGIKVIGNGRNQTRLIWPSSALSAGIYVPYTTTSSRHLFDFRDMSLLREGYGGDGIKVEGVSGGGSPAVQRGFVQNLDIKRFRREEGFGSWENAINLIQVHGAVINACTFQGDAHPTIADTFYGAGIKYSGVDGVAEVPAHINITDCTARNLDYGANVSRCEGIYFTNFRAFGVDTGVYYDNVGRNDPQVPSPRITVRGGHISARRYGVYFKNTQMGQINNVYFLHGNVVDNPAYEHIRLQGTLNTVVSNNQIEGLNLSQARGVSMIGGATDNYVTGNAFITSGGQAVYIASNAGTNYVGENAFRYNAWGTYIQNNTQFSRIKGEKVTLIRDDSQQIPDNVITNVFFQRAAYKTLGLGFYDVNNRDRITILDRGRYRIKAFGSFQANPNGIRLMDIRINGGNLVGSGVASSQALSTGPTYLHLESDILILDKDDYVSLSMLQTSGGSLSAEGNAALSLEYLGEV